MRGIGIIGSGIAALQLALLLQKHSVPVSLYSDRSPAQMRAGRLPSTVARFAYTQEREQLLGVDYWNTPEFGFSQVNVLLNGQPPIAFCGRFSQAASFVDMRIYQSRLLAEFEARGGQVAVGALEAGALSRLAARHELLVVATGRGGLAGLFPRLPEHSPFAAPQRRLFAGLFHGIEQPRALSFVVAPGQGEIFSGPFYSFAGHVSNILLEAIPGQELEMITTMRYEDHPKLFEAALIDLLRVYAPPIYERVNPAEFRLTGPLDLLQGAITPLVRRGYAALGSGRFALALGDAHIVNDPILAQGANMASRAAWLMGEAIVSGGPYDEEFCRRVEQRIWQAVRPATEWTNANLMPPPPHMLDVFLAAGQNQMIADALIDGFGDPRQNWEIYSDPQRAAAFITALRDVSAEPRLTNVSFQIDKGGPMESIDRGTQLPAEQQRMVELWEAHMAAEFEARNVEATLKTMSEDPHLLLIPLPADDVAGMAGVRDFYSHDFIPAVSAEAEYAFTPISRTIGADRIVDELVFKFTHSVEMPWMLPGVPPTGKRVEIPLVVIVAFKDGKIDSEHLYWDQAAVLAQIGLLETDQLPIAGLQAARRLERLAAPEAVAQHSHTGMGPIS